MGVPKAKGVSEFVIDYVDIQIAVDLAL